MTSEQTVSLRRDLLDLGLRGLHDAFDDLVARATKQRLGPVECFEEAVRIEKRDRARRSLERRQTRSKVGSFKPMDEFDWNWPKHIDRGRVERALGLHFMEEGFNQVIAGPHGVAKTMIAQNIAHQGILKGYSVLFTTAARLLNDLGSTESKRALELRIRHYAAVTLLCIDELGYLSYDSHAADLLFEIITRRHAAKKPIVLTTNLAFKDWGSVFPSATCTVALVDRLTHRADILHIQADSWRRKEAKEREGRFSGAVGD